MSVRGVPVQDLPQNQDPSVAYILDEVTGAKTPLPGGPLDVKEKGSVVEDAAPPKKRGRPRKELAKELGSQTDEPAEDSESDSEN